MAKENLNDLQAFVVVARERSFTRAAAQMGVSRSALSHSMLALEARLGVRLLTRTTRSVSVTDAGARLLNTLAPRLQDIERELESLTAMRDKPAGTVRITTHDHAIATVLWPRLMPLLKQYPDIEVEFSVDYGFTDIAAERFDAGVRVGDRVDKDMVAVPIAPALRMAVAASPEYLAGKPVPMKPADLTAHRCVNLRLPTHGGLYAWDFEKGKKTGQRAGSRPDGVQQHLPDAARGTGRHGLRLRAFRHRGTAHQGGVADSGSAGLVADLPGLPPLLRQSSPAFAGARPRHRSPEIPDAAAQAGGVTAVTGAFPV
ncbi:DNA-binding transcriptional LysR family regulator [Variovorax paradoxus]|nr:DNA-binding transcriptional LysR family regulator [Variovorax paradoxus]